MNGAIAVPLARSAHATSPWLLGLAGALALELLAATFAWQAALLAYVLREGMAGAGTAPPDAGSVAAYTLNFIGGAVSRYATALAPWIAGLALVSACHLAWRLRRERAALPWLGWILFATLAGVLVAVGRAGPSVPTTRS